NILRLYRNDQAGGAVKEFDFNKFLEVSGKAKQLESDLEAAARIGDRIYWLGSHGRTKKGVEAPNRCRLFATDIKFENGEVSLTPVGQPCKTLLDNLVAEAKFARFHFADAAKLAPK